MIIAIFIAVTFIFSLSKGSINISAGDIWNGMHGNVTQNAAVVFSVRLPRLLVAILAGAALAVSGTLLQAVMKNPLTDPGIIGISSAAALMAAIVSGLFPMLFYSKPVSKLAAAPNAPPTTPTIQATYSAAKPWPSSIGFR